jgi:hypothetical protein
LQQSSLHCKQANRYQHISLATGGFDPAAVTPDDQLHIFSFLPVMILSGFGTPSRHTMGDNA